MGLDKVKITLFEKDSIDFIRTVGPEVGTRIIQEFKKNKISIIRNAEILNINGDHKLRSILFNIKGSTKEYYIKPDLYISEGPLTKVDHSFHNTIFFNKPKYRPELDANGAFKIDRRFSIMLHLNYKGMFACGQNALHRSFLGNKPFRSTNTGFNIESGFFAALNMLNKEVKFQYLPLQRLTIGDKEMYFYGERNNAYEDVIIEGDINSDKFVVYYIRNNVVCGILTFGYTNLHLYLIEAMKLLIFPDGK